MSKRSFLFLIVAGVSACSTQNDVAPETPFQNELAFTAAREGDLSELEIQVLVAGDADGETEFQFPAAWGPEEDLGALRGALTVVDAVSGDPLVSDESNGSVTVAHAPGQPIRLSWTVKQDYDGLPEWGVQRVPGMRPVLQAGYASIIGHTVLPAIEGRDPEFVVRFDGLSSGAAFSQPSTDGRSRPVALSNATDSIYAFGDYAFSEPADSIVRAAVLGDWALSNDDLIAATSAVLATASSAFDDRPPSQYFVAFTPLPDVPNGSSVIGTAFTESFFILATRNADAENLEHTLIHEILHEWIPGRMGTTDEATDPARMWFTEGFTEYYTQLVLLDSGRVSLEGFLANFNELWAAYQTSPVQTMPSGELLTHIWDSRETERLPYQRGALMALSWETAAAGRGTSLADALADLIDRGDAQRASGAAAELTDAAIREALEKAVGPVFAQDLSGHIEQGNLIEPADLSLPGCLTVNMTGEGPARLALAEGADPAACRAALVSSLHRGG